MCTYSRTVFSCGHESWGRRLKNCPAGDEYRKGTRPLDCAIRKQHGLHTRKLSIQCDTCVRIEDKLVAVRGQLDRCRDEIRQKLPPAITIVVVGDAHGYSHGSTAVPRGAITSSSAAAAVAQTQMHRRQRSYDDQSTIQRMREATALLAAVASEQDGEQQGATPGRSEPGGWIFSDNGNIKTCFCSSTTPEKLPRTPSPRRSRLPTPPSSSSGSSRSRRDGLVLASLTPLASSNYDTRPSTPSTSQTTYMRVPKRCYFDRSITELASGSGSAGNSHIVGAMRPPIFGSSPRSSSKGSVQTIESSSEDAEVVVRRAPPSTPGSSPPVPKKSELRKQKRAALLLRGKTAEGAGDTLYPPPLALTPGPSRIPRKSVTLRPGPAPLQRMSRLPRPGGSRVASGASSTATRA